MTNKTKVKENLSVLIEDCNFRIKKTIELEKPYWENFDLWRQSSLDCLEQVYEPNHRNLNEFAQIRFVKPAGDDISQRVTFIVGVQIAQEKLFATLLSVDSYWDEGIKTMTYPTIFLSCSEKSKKIAEKIKLFLTNLGAKVIFVSDEPNLNLSPDDKVSYYMAQCDCGIAVLTADERLENGEHVNRRNIDHELGLMSKSPNIGGRIITLKENNLKKASNHGEKIDLRFNKGTFGDDVYPALVKELRAFRYF